jgi:DNA-binding YbaB/EbfC family protein
MAKGIAPRGNAMKGAFSNLMKQAQEMQANLQKAQEELASLVITGESGGGMVRVVMSGRHEVRSVAIDDSLIGDDKEMLEDLVAAAINDAVQKVERTVQEKFSGLASGLNLPGGLKLPI